MIAGAQTSTGWEGAAGAAHAQMLQALCLHSEAEIVKAEGTTAAICRADFQALLNAITVS